MILFVLVCVDEMLRVSVNELILSSDDIFGSVVNVFIFIGVIMDNVNFILIVEFILNGD